MIFHKPVLVNEVLQYLDPQPGQVYVDATFGGGGHTRAILQKQPQCKVIGIDWDVSTLETNGVALQAEFPGRLELVWANFAQLDRKLKEIGIVSVDGILADFGTSYFQLTEKPGFSVYKDTVLDMRMAPSHQKLTAAEVLNKASQEKLTEIFRDLGQDPSARLIARLIVQERTKKPFQTTMQLATFIEKALGWKKKGIHPATKFFQALRIYVNKEQENIKGFLTAATRILAPGGRLLCISFHSLEDRLVKEFFKQAAVEVPPSLHIVTTKVVVPTQEEIQKNPSARSAKLRVARKV